MRDRAPGATVQAMSPAAVNALGMIVATILMLLAGLSKKRLEWKPRDETRRGRKPPGTA
jgi:hypothetical protein